MAPKLLILGGTTEASAFAQLVADRALNAVFSYAGRVASPKAQPLPTRVGGFGGVDGLVQYLQEHSITHVVDATHPFAAQMSRNAFEACQKVGAQLVALTRPAWQAQDGDNWSHVADIEGAVAALGGEPRRVFLALGKLNVPAFAARPQHHYVLRLVDTPESPPPLPHHTVLVARGPFDLAGDRTLMQEHAIDAVVCKNAGGLGAKAKLTAARELGVPVIMIDRPTLPDRPAVATAESCLAFIEST